MNMIGSETYDKGRYKVPSTFLTCNINLKCKSTNGQMSNPLNRSMIDFTIVKLL
jgi:hypothetical protein